jgi:hypothetical protein
VKFLRQVVDYSTAFVGPEALWCDLSQITFCAEAIELTYRVTQMFHLGSARSTIIERYEKVVLQLKYEMNSVDAIFTLCRMRQAICDRSLWTN